MFTNVDMLIGLNHQKEGGFLDDITRLCKIHPSQITIYPYMAIRGLVANSHMPDERQFGIIEKSWNIISKERYTRRGPWTFTNTTDLYDSSRDELVEDYIGFGPAAFSGYGGYRYVNPPVDLYLHYWEPTNEPFQPCALVSVNDPESIEWRRLARMIGDLHIDPTYNFSKTVNIVLSVLKFTGYIRKNNLTKKGMNLAHHLMKKVVENLPFPLQNPAVILNYSEYKSKLLEYSENENKPENSIQKVTSSI